MQATAIDQAPLAGPHRPATAAPSSLIVAGHVPHPCEFSLQALRRFEPVVLGATQVNCFSGRPVAALQSCTGVRLTDVLDAAGFSALPRSILKRCIVAAQGSDDYRAIFSWCELYNAAIGPQVLVLYERDGQALAERLGPLALLSAADRQLGPRHLRQLRSVIVQLL